MKECDNIYSDRESGDTMLLQFKFKNHKCFADESILDLTATQEKRHKEKLINLNGNDILPVIEIHGANASGKTTVIEALAFMFQKVKESLTLDINVDLDTKSFAFSDKTKNSNSEYEVSLCFGNYEYRYGFTINPSGYDEEWLYKRRFSKSNVSVESIMFERVKNKIDFSRSLTKYNDILKLYNNEVVSTKMLLLSFIGRKEKEGPIREIYDYICGFKVKLDYMDLRSISVDILHENTSVFSSFQKIVNSYDPCLKGINIQEIKNDLGKKKYEISGIHDLIDNNKKKVLIPLENESFGTIKIFNILPSILISLESGSLLCIDELDVKLHPLLFKKIVSMYMDKKINKKNAQLIFTAHSTFLLNSNDTRRDQIYLVDKNKMGQSKLYSLSDFRNLRVDADYENKYLTGQFGAIPFEDK